MGFEAKRSGACNIRCWSEGRAVRYDDGDDDDAETVDMVGRWQ